MREANNYIYIEENFLLSVESVPKIKLWIAMHGIIVMGFIGSAYVALCA